MEIVDSDRWYKQMAGQYYQTAGADLLERIHQRRMEVQHARHAVFWTTVNFFVMFILCFDMWVDCKSLAASFDCLAELIDCVEV